jgi:flagellar protein FliJ
MRKFHFRLERILHIRRHTAKQKEIELAGAVTECLRIENEMEAVHQVRRAEVLSPDHATDMSYRISQSAYLSYLDHRTKTLSRELATAEQVREERKERYLEASREEKVLEKLRERQEAEHYKEQRRDETRLLDEIALNKHSRSKKIGDETTGRGELDTGEYRDGSV